MLEQRDYQTRIIDRTLAAVDQGHRSILIEAACSAGKTVMVHVIAQRLYERYGRPAARSDLGGATSLICTYRKAPWLRVRTPTQGIPFRRWRPHFRKSGAGHAPREKRSLPLVSPNANLESSRSHRWDGFQLLISRCPGSFQSSLGTGFSRCRTGHRFQAATLPT